MSLKCCSFIKRPLEPLPDSAPSVLLVLVAALVPLDDAVLDRQKLDLDPPRRLLVLHRPVMEVGVEASQAAVDEKKVVQLLVYQSGKPPLIGVLQPPDRGARS